MSTDSSVSFLLYGLGTFYPCTLSYHLVFTLKISDMWVSAHFGMQTIILVRAAWSSVNSMCVGCPIWILMLLICGLLWVISALWSFPLLLEWVKSPIWSILPIISVQVDGLFLLVEKVRLYILLVVLTFAILFPACFWSIQIGFKMS